MRYPESFKTNMVRKMLAGVSANALARETGVHQTTLSRWRQESGKLGTMKNKNGRRPQDWSPEEKLALALEAASVPDDDFGAFLRRKGVHQADLTEWRGQMVSGLKAGRRETFGKSPDARRARELERELRRKDAALAETAALLVLQKKVRAVWGDEAESTRSRSGK